MDAEYLDEILINLPRNVPSSHIRLKVQTRKISYELATKPKINLANMDNLLIYFSQEKTRIVQLLMSDIITLTKILWTQNSPINKDDNCLCRVGLFPTGVTIGHNSNCVSCQMIGRLTNLNKDTCSKEIVLEYSKYKGYKLDLVSHNCHKFFLKVVPNWSNALSSLLFHHGEYIECEPDLEFNDKTIYIGGDEFTNQILNTWAVESILTTFGLPPPQQLHHAFICGSVGYGLYDHPDIGNIRDLIIRETNNEKVMKVSVATQITQQLIFILYILSEYSFSHGRPGLDCLKFSKDKIDTIYDNKSLRTDFSLHLSNFQYSSLSIRCLGPDSGSNDICRLFCHSSVGDIVQHIDNESRIERKMIYDENILVYRLPNNIHDYIARLRYTGYGLHRSSHDLYSFWMALMLYTLYRQALEQIPKYMELWKNLWLESEYNTLMYELEKINNYDINMDPMPWLMNRWLRCSALEYVWNNLPN